MFTITNWWPACCIKVNIIANFRSISKASNSKLCWQSYPNKAHYSLPCPWNSSSLSFLCKNTFLHILLRYFYICSTNTHTFPRRFSIHFIFQYNSNPIYSELHKREHRIPSKNTPNYTLCILQNNPNQMSIYFERKTQFKQEKLCQLKPKQIPAPPRSYRRPFWV